MTCIPLANPKNLKVCCELCSKPAFIFCEKCRVTYYCDAEHQRVDWLGIHEKICQMLIPLRTPIPFISGSEKEREYRNQQQVLRQKQLIDVSSNAGQKLLFEGKYEYAIPAAMQTLKFTMEVYGSASIELASPYLMLGESCIGLLRLLQADEYLHQAQWIILKNSFCDNSIKSRMHRNFGMLFATQKKHTEALHHFAQDIYYSSLAFGTNNIRTSGGYFHMANVFYQQNKRETAYSLYGQLTSMWNDTLFKMVEQLSVEAANLPQKKLIDNSNEDNCFLDEVQGAEAVKILHTILDLHENQKPPFLKELTKNLFTLAMLYTILENFVKAKEFLSKALSTAKLYSSEEKRLNWFESIYLILENKPK
nr:zinc finger MYND domain-containing protein 12 [Hydra vulgaris]